MLSNLDQPDSEAQLLLWPGYRAPEYALLHLWEGVRGAGLLHARMLQEPTNNAPQSPTPGDDVIVMKVLASIQALRDVRKEACHPNLSDHVVYPLFIASIATGQGTHERQLAMQSWQVLLQGAERHKNQTCYDIVLEVWKRRETLHGTSPWIIANDFAKELNIEYYLS